jgi:CheY-like chemotaxis protein
VPVVIVDDSREDALLAVHVLQQCKILNPITVLSSGAECIRFLDGQGEHAKRTLPCLVLLDLVMNPVTGVDVLQHIQSAPHLRECVVVMLSGIQDLKIVNEGYRLGASTFLIKPLRCEDVMQLTTSVRGLAVERNNSGYILGLDPVAKKQTGVLAMML